MTLKRYIKLYHSNLGDTAGLNPRLYPADDNTHYTRAGFVHDIYSETGAEAGNYIIEINPFEDTDVGYLISSKYDLYFSGAKKNSGENIDLGLWEFITKEITVSSDALAITFASLYLDYTLYGLVGDIALPAYIARASVEPIVNENSGLYVHSGSITTSGFTVSRKIPREKDDVKVQFVIRGG